VVWLTAVVVVGLPLIWLLIQGGRELTRGESGSEVHWSASLLMEPCWTALQMNLRELTLSLGLSQLVAAACLVTAGPLAWWGRVAGKLPRALLLIPTALGLAIPGPLVAMAVIGVLDRPGWTLLNWFYDHTLVPIWLVHVVRCWPWAFLILAGAMKGIPSSLIEVSRLDGHSALAAYGRWVVPLTLAAQTATWFLVTGLSLSELSGSILVAPPGLTPFSVAFFSTLHYGTRYELASLCLIVWLLASLLTGLGWWNGSYGWRRGSNGVR